MKLEYLNFKNTKIPLIFEENNDLPIIVLKLIFKNCGRSFDLIPGTARMLVRILNEGVDDNFFKELELKAINLSASSGFETLEINLSLLKEYKEFAFKSLANLLEKPRFNEKILQKNKFLALSELASKNSDFDYLAKNLLNSNTFDYKEFQSPNDGNEESIKQITLKDLKDFFKRHLNLSNLIITLGGDFVKKDIQKLLELILNPLVKGEKIPDKKFNLTSKIKDVSLVRKESEQAYIYFASPFYGNIKDNDIYMAKISHFILGQAGFGSRIMEEIRVKRGLAYSAYAMLDLNLSYNRIFGYLQTKNENAQEAKKIIKQVFNEFVEKGVNEEELNQAKNFLLGNTPLRYESLSKRLNIAFYEFYRDLELGYYKNELQNIEKVNLNEINAYIKKHNEILQLSFASLKNED
ncbi:M16 family metallopeptidase [Campylobacter sp. TTU_617]|uniref:M16 family metallopeptidase n=2 Tax=unclassified Campylobacter TaxID=2593542 RepID=UPI001903FE30|nr:pitrilysin family protein [Campylobacter sp. TTU_617]MBK1971450.1 insulinase family protein [Campylobacter sp. TTU_617]